MIDRLKQWWKTVRVWWWYRGLEVIDTKNAEIFLQKELHGLQEMAKLGKPPYLLAERPKWLDECLNTEADTSTPVRTEEMYEPKGDLKDE